MAPQARARGSALVLVVMLVVAVSCSPSGGGSATSDEDRVPSSGAGTSTSEAEGSEPAADPQDVEVVETGWADVYSRYPEFTWVAIVRNPNEDQTAVGLRVRATYFGADGEVVSTCGLVYPHVVPAGSETTVSGAGEPIADSVEIEVSAVEWSTTAAAPDVSFSKAELVDLTEPVARGAIGEITNHGSSEAAGSITAALRDSDGALVGWAGAGALFAGPLAPGSSERIRAVLPKCSDNPPESAEFFLEATISSSPQAEKTCEPDLSPSLPR